MNTSRVIIPRGSASPRDIGLLALGIIIFWTAVSVMNFAGLQTISHIEAGIAFSMILLLAIIVIEAVR